MRCERPVFFQSDRRFTSSRLPRAARDEEAYRQVLDATPSGDLFAPRSVETASRMPDLRATDTRSSRPCVHKHARQNGGLPWACSRRRAKPVLPLSIKDRHFRTVLEYHVQTGGAHSPERDDGLAHHHALRDIYRQVPCSASTRDRRISSRSRNDTPLWWRTVVRIQRSRPSAQSTLQIEGATLPRRRGHSSSQVAPPSPQRSTIVTGLARVAGIRLQTDRWVRPPGWNASKRGW